MLKNAARTIAASLEMGGRVLVCGNGGSASQASHFAAELVGRGRDCLALNDPAILTALANDYGYERVFALQVEAYGAAGDVLIAISTSGTSENVLQAVATAKDMGLHVICLGPSDEDETTAEIQEAHLFILHLLDELIEAQR
jgi:D-sedoheptulose 7-phosphate isomerase